MKLEISRQIFENNFNIKVHENPCSRSRVVSCGPTDRHEAGKAVAVLRTRITIKVYSNYIQVFSSNRAVNRLRLGYKNQSVNAVQ
jgi:hypothetical protein